MDTTYFMNTIKKNLLVFTVVATFLSIPLFSFAQTVVPAPSENTKIVNPLGEDGPQTVQEFIANVLVGFLKIGIPLVALAIIYCGFLFVSAMGNSEKLTKAKDAFLYTVIGAGILLGAWAIAQLITDTVLEIGK